MVDSTASQVTQRQDTGNPSKKHRLRQAECKPHVDKGVTYRARETHAIFCYFHIRMNPFY